MSGESRPDAGLAAKPLVLFDAGGTLITLDEVRVRALIEPEAPAFGSAELVRAEARARRWADAEIRRRSTSRALWEGYFSRFFAELRVRPERVGALVDALWDVHQERGLWTDPIPGARETCLRLREAGKRLAVISNAEGKVARDLEGAGFAGLFETVVDSHLVGVSKPDPRIFAIALERLGARAEDALYVGDVPAFDVVGARAAAIEPVLIDPHDVHAEVEVTKIREIIELPALLGCH